MRFDSVQELETIGRAGARLVDDEQGTRARYLSSFWLYIEPEDQAFSIHWPTGYWESWVSMWLSQQWGRHDTFFDIGANVGYFTMQAAKAGVNRVVAVEPNPKLVKMISDSRSVNRCLHNVDIWDNAFSDYTGRANLWVPEGHSGGASIEGSAEGFEVNVWRFDEAFISWDKSRRLLFKIDAEGSEPKIWAGMEKTLKTHDHTVLLEWHGVRYDRVAFAEELLKNHDLSIIDYSGIEWPITREWLLQTEELHMICARPKETNG